MLDRLTEIDRNISEKMHDFEYNLLHSFFHAYTALGSLHFSFLLAFTLFYTGHTAILKQLFIVVAVSLTITEIIKILVSRERPDDRDEDVYIMQDLSFPSGHATNAFATAGVLTGFGNLGLLPIPIAALVAFSRVYLGQHYLSDIVAGAVIGGSVALILV